MILVFNMLGLFKSSHIGGFVWLQGFWMEKGNIFSLIFYLDRMGKEKLSCHDSCISSFSLINLVNNLFLIFILDDLSNFLSILYPINNHANSFFLTFLTPTIISNLALSNKTSDLPMNSQSFLLFTSNKLRAYLFAVLTSM